MWPLGFDYMSYQEFTLPFNEQNLSHPILKYAIQLNPTVQGESVPFLPWDAVIWRGDHIPCFE